MPHKVTKTTTVFSLDELKEVDPAAHSLALDYLFERAEESWYSLDYPEVLNNFQTQNGQPDLTCDFNLEQHFATPSGYLKVPAEMSASWSEDDGPEIQRVPVGQFRNWTGWLYTVGGESYTWIPDDDGVILEATTKDLMADLLERLDASYAAATSNQSLSDLASNEGFLFDSHGGFECYLEDLTS